MFTESPFLVNLSSHILTPSQVTLLEKGLSFVPTICRTSYKDILLCKTRNIRNLKLRDFFRSDNRYYDPSAFEFKFLAPSTWTPPLKSLNLETVEALKDITTASQTLLAHRFLRNCHSVTPMIRCRDNSSLNLSHDELRSIQELRNLHSIIIKPADKGGAVVLMDSSLYKAEGLRQLSNTHYYQEISSPLAPLTISKIMPILQKLLSSGFITERQFKFLAPSLPSSQRSFYLLPKIHKSISKWPNSHMPEGRPIVSDCGSETYNICSFIDFFLQPLSVQHPSYLKDTYDFVEKIRFKPIPPTAFLVTGDVTSLYTNMDIDRSIAVVKQVFAENPDPTRPDDAILELLEICLRNNDFMFASHLFLQICGTAMGKTFAPSLANLYLRELDRCAVTGFRIIPQFYFRFLDDIFFVWPGTKQDLLEFNDFLNSILPGIKITLTIREQIIEFLDTRIYKFYSQDICSLRTRVFFKSTDTHQLLHYSSFHPRHTTKGILKSQLIRFKRLSSFKYEFDYSSRILFNVLRHRGYSRSLFRRLKNEVWFSPMTYSFRERLPSKEQIFPIINFHDRIGNKLTRIFHSTISSLNLFHNCRIVRAYKIHKNLSQLLIRSRFDG
ncbi:MAG TPA: hypothetical protein PLL93_08260 [bacterium]|nr:hypothetical protein [bacterium]